METLSKGKALDTPAARAVEERALRKVWAVGPEPAGPPPFPQARPAAVVTPVPWCTCVSLARRNTRTRRGR